MTPKVPAAILGKHFIHERFGKIKILLWQPDTLRLGSVRGREQDALRCAFSVGGVHSLLAEPKVLGHQGKKFLILAAPKVAVT